MGAALVFVDAQQAVGYSGVPAGVPLAVGQTLEPARYSRARPLALPLMVKAVEASYGALGEHCLCPDGAGPYKDAGQRTVMAQRGLMSDGMLLWSPDRHFAAGNHRKCR
jgi:hypothetical protein